MADLRHRGSLRRVVVGRYRREQGSQPDVDVVDLTASGYKAARRYERNAVGKQYCRPAIRTSDD
jgi:hypothetical protein